MVLYDIVTQEESDAHKEIVYHGDDSKWRFLGDVSNSILNIFLFVKGILYEIFSKFIYDCN